MLPFSTLFGENKNENFPCKTQLKARTITNYLIFHSYNEIIVGVQLNFTAKNSI